MTTSVSGNHSVKLHGQLHSGKRFGSEISFNAYRMKILQRTFVQNPVGGLRGELVSSDVRMGGAEQGQILSAFANE